MKKPLDPMLPNPKQERPERVEERLRKAREKASEYLEKRQEQPEEPATTGGRQRAVRPLGEWQDLVGQRIEEAMRDGAFDNLPGRGKRLNLRRNPFVPEDQQLAYQLLQNNNLAPAWIGERQEVLRKIESWRVQLRQQVAEVQAEARPGGAEQTYLRQRWERQVAIWEAEILELNRRITTLNLQQPVAHLEVFKLILDEELARLGVSRHTFS